MSFGRGLHEVMEASANDYMNPSWATAFYFLLENPELKFYIHFTLDNVCCYTQFFSCFLYLEAYLQSASDTFKPCVSPESSTAPVACGYCREVLAVSVISEESTVCLEEQEEVKVRRKKIKIMWALFFHDELEFKIK